MWGCMLNVRLRSECAECESIDLNVSVQIQIALLPSSSDLLEHKLASLNMRLIVRLHKNVWLNVRVQV